jgi:DNA-binding transcriptional regulator YhcF (GntR family)
MEDMRYKYRKIVEDILGKIERGELYPGARLPGARMMAAQQNCHYHTARRAYAKLAESGHVELRSGSGTYVADKAAAENPRRRLHTEKALRSSDRLGVLLPVEQWGYYISTLVSKLHCSAERRGIKLNIRTVKTIDCQSSYHVQEFVNQGCCALVLPWIPRGQHVGDLHDFVRESELPVVLPELISGMEKNCYQLPEQRQKGFPNAIVMRGRYFQALGFKHIALLGSFDDAAEYLRCRTIQYMDWVSHENLPNLFELAGEGEHDFDPIIDRWLPMRGDLAVIACHDDLALEFMDACRRRGVGIPDDFAVIGHRRNPNGFRYDPELSSMRCDYEYIADGMIVHALALSNGSSCQLASHAPTEILVRKSCGGHLRLGEHAEEMAASLSREMELAPA